MRQPLQGQVGFSATLFIDPACGTGIRTHLLIRQVEFERLKELILDGGSQVIWKNIRTPEQSGEKRQCRLGLFLALADVGNGHRDRAGLLNLFDQSAKREAQMTGRGHSSTVSGHFKVRQAVGGWLHGGRKGVHAFLLAATTIQPKGGAWA